MVTNRIEPAQARSGRAAAISCPGVARFRTRHGLRCRPRAAVSAPASGRRGPTLLHQGDSAGRTGAAEWTLFVDQRAACGSLLSGSSTRERDREGNEVGEKVQIGIIDPLPAAGKRQHQAFHRNLRRPRPVGARPPHRRAKLRAIAEAMRAEGVQIRASVVKNTLGGLMCQPLRRRRRRARLRIQCVRPRLATRHQPELSGWDRSYICRQGTAPRYNRSRLRFHREHRKRCISWRRSTFQISLSIVPAPPLR